MSFAEECIFLLMFITHHSVHCLCEMIQLGGDSIMWGFNYRWLRFYNHDIIPLYPSVHRKLFSRWLHVLAGFMYRYSLYCLSIVLSWIKDYDGPYDVVYLLLDNTVMYICLIVWWRNLNENVRNCSLTQLFFMSSLYYKFENIWMID